MRLLFFNILLLLAVNTPRIPPLEYRCYYNIPQDTTLVNLFENYEKYSSIDFVHLETGLSLRKNKDSQINNDLKDSLVKWIGKMSFVPPKTTELYYIGSIKKAKTQVFHFFFLYVSDNTQYVYAFVEYEKIITAIIETEHYYALPDEWTARLIRLSRKRLIISYKAEASDMMIDGEFVEDENWKQVIKLEKGHAHIVSRKKNRVPNDIVDFFEY